MNQPSDPAFELLYKSLTTDAVGAAEVAVACLRYAILRTDAGYAFDSVGERALDVYGRICTIVGGDLRTFLAPEEVDAIAQAVADSNDRPMAAWCAAHRISLAISQDFSASVHGPSVQSLEDMQPFPVATGACSTIYGGTKGLSARPRPERRRNDPSSVGGLALWRRSKAGSFNVIIDRVGGEQFSRSVDHEGSLRVALIQPNQSLDELCLKSLSAPSDADCRFFGIRPHNEDTQVERVLTGLRHAADAGAGIALLPELVMTESAVAAIAGHLSEPGTVVCAKADSHALRVVISGSFHHVDADQQRNSVRVHFPRAGAVNDRQHSKSGFFALTVPRTVLEAMVCDHSSPPKPTAVAASGTTSTDTVEFREDIVATNEVRLYLGAKLSAVVVICADLLEGQLLDVLEALAPSVTLVCNMTEKNGDFKAAANALVLAGQTTSVAVNNPADWFGNAVEGALVGMPLAKYEHRIVTANFPDRDHILVFDSAARGLSIWPEELPDGTAVDRAV
ncbi:hypothetical protein [Mycolicibacterium sp. lyk4-40-TYG-92]|uniref:hypothetical protein n=1 Tax=Mycolicibacterium sp. lyk4-40-TYG-92 TaxID=3040295 RepID=UPI0025500C59|nr:hypothetical protein [Mycolicibacterium sp. lyk4-40-TYG-92]